MVLILILLILFYSIILHEISHGAAAYLNGDPTARDMKRLTLNPLSHVDFLGTIVLPLALFFLKAPFLFGWAKPVPYNPRYFRNRLAGLFTVSFAGPATNVFLAFLFSLILRLVPKGGELAQAMVYGVTINLMLAIFNLIPIPPLDGSKTLSVFMPRRLRAAYLSMDRWGLLVILLLLYTGWLNRFLMPAVQYALNWFLG